MTIPQASEPTNIELDLNKVETVHVSFGTQKIACLCLVVEDDANSASLIDDISATGRMVITDVTPHRTNPNKADVIFRNISNDEILDFGRRMLLPPGTIASVFEEFITTTLFADGDVEIVSSDEVSSTAEDEEEWDEEDSPFIEDIEESNLIQIISQHSHEIPEQSQNTYSVTVSLAEAHMAQMLHIGTNAPAFMLATRSTMEAIEGLNEPTEDDYLAILEFPTPDTAEYFESTGSLIQSVTGAYRLNISGEAMRRIRGDIISQILRVADGSRDALIDMFSFINPLLKAQQVVARRTEGDRDAKPTTKDIELCFMAEAADRIYNLMAPSTIASLIQNKRDSGEFMQDIDTVNRLLKDSGIESVFEELLDEHNADEVSFLMPPTASSSQDDIVAYYSAAISPETFPESMRSLLSLMQMPLLYEYDWASGIVDIKETSSNSSEIVVAKLITTAVRFARMQTLVENTTIPLNPIGFLIQGLNYPGEPLGWSFSEAIRHLSIEDGGGKFFSELMRAGLPKDSSTTAHENLMGNPIAQILHRIGHIVMDEGWEKEVLSPFLEDKPLISSFIDDLYETEHILTEEDLDEEVEGCAPILATASLLLKNMEYSELVDQIGQFLVLLSELNALRSTNFQKGTIEWKNFLNSYLAAVLEIQHHEES